MPSSARKKKSSSRKGLASCSGDQAARDTRASVRPRPLNGSCCVCSRWSTVPWLFCLLTRRPPRSTLFPYTTLSDLALLVSAALILLLTHRPGAVGGWHGAASVHIRSEEHTSELQSRVELVCRLLLEKKNHHHEKDWLLVQGTKLLAILAPAFDPGR